MRMCRYAIESNFGWPVPPIVKPEFNVHDHLAASRSPQEDSTGRTTVGRCIWDCRSTVAAADNGNSPIEGGHVVGATQGVGDRCTATFYLNTRTFEAIANQTSTVDSAVEHGTRAD